MNTTALAKKMEKPKRERKRERERERERERRFLKKTRRVRRA